MDRAAAGDVRTIGPAPTALSALLLLASGASAITALAMPDLVHGIPR